MLLVLWSKKETAEVSSFRTNVLDGRHEFITKNHKNVSKHNV